MERIVIGLKEVIRTIATCKGEVSDHSMRDIIVDQ
jgi:hypothetical protein